MFTEAALALRDSNVEEFLGARVFFLLGKHSKTPGIEQILQEQFNARFVESAWKEGDQLWVEESASLPAINLKKNQVRLIKTERKFVAGWDNPEVCERAERIAQEVLHLPFQEATSLKHQFVFDTFSQRQRFLSCRIQNYIKENEGRLFIMAGEHHASTKDPRFESEAKKLLEELKEAKVAFSVFMFKIPEAPLKSETPPAVEKVSYFSTLLKFVQNFFA